MTKLKMTTLAAALLGVVSTAAMAGSNKAIDDFMSRRGPGSTSGSGDTVEANCATDPSGNAWQGATATLEIKQKGGKSKVEVEVEGAVPNTLFTVWVRIKGKNGLNSAGSPLTGGGATPLAPGYTLDALNAISPWVDPAGAPASANSFTTDASGEAEFEIDLDFPVVRGAYPFQMTATSRPGHEGHANVPTAIADPREAGQEDTPFLIRVVSHCTDNMSHGLSPATREAWFQYP
ncbi:MAG TPA: hypothetical protein ENJ80_13345 [Gammaproteobacteria bacterium]|nr:hypothetical protein [Gammaproteobacteria bacterium]